MLLRHNRFVLSGSKPRTARVRIGHGSYCGRWTTPHAHARGRQGTERDRPAYEEEGRCYAFGPPRQPFDSLREGSLAYETAEGERLSVETSRSDRAVNLALALGTLQGGQRPLAGLARRQRDLDSVASNHPHLFHSADSLSNRGRADVESARDGSVGGAGVPLKLDQDSSVQFVQQILAHHRSLSNWKESPI